MKKKRIISLLLLCVMLMGIATTVVAATTTITNETESVKYFEYYSSGAWHDLNTPVHRDASGNIAYCIDHESEPPGSSTQYKDFNASAVFSSNTIKGIQAILDHGYPISTGGMSNAKAHYATANAIRWWIKESTGQGYNFMTPGSSNLRAKSSGTDVWSWAQQLLGYARSGATTGGGGSNKITVSSMNLKWSLQGSQLTTTLTVQAPNGYTISPSSSSVTIMGYTGGTYDTLYIYAPLSIMGTTVSLFIQGKSGGSASSALLYWYEPNDPNKQRVVVTTLIPDTPDSGTVTITGEFYDLTVKKTDSYTGSALDGAVFQLNSGGSPVGLVQNSAGNYTAGGSLTQFTTSGGQAVIRGLPSGDYSLVEVSAPSAAYIASGSTSVRLYSNTTTTVQNTPTKITVIKTNGLTKQPMPGVTFTLTDSGGAPVKLIKAGDGTYRPDSSGSNEFTVDSNGRAVIMYLPKGSYVAHEATREGYADFTGGSFTLNGEVTINAANDPLALMLTKVDSFTGKVLPGITFDLLDAGGASVKLSKQSDGVYHYDSNGVSGFETGANGTATIYYIPAGNYTVRETGLAGLGYAEAKDVSVTITRGNSYNSPATVSFVNDPISLEFTKIDDLTRLPLDGAVFQLKDANDEIVKLKKIEEGSYKPDTGGADTFTTKNGSAVIRYLTPQAYTIVELEPPEGYTKDTDKTVVVTSKNDVSNAAKAAMSDKPLALEFSKLDKMTGSLLDGCEFTLKDSGGKTVKLTKVSEGVYMPDKNGGNTFTTSGGKALIGPISPGQYTISEVNVKAGFAKTTQDVSVTVTNENISSNPAKVSMDNVPLALTVTKIDGETKAPFGGTQFKLLDKNGSTVRVSPLPGKAGWYMPDNSGSEAFAISDMGSATIAYLPESKYSVAEVSEVPGYAKIMDAIPVEVVEENVYTKPGEATIENHPLAMEVLKTDALNGKPLPNVGFRIEDADGNALRFIKISDGEYRVSKDGSEDFQTGSLGRAIVKLIPEGSYTLFELDNPGYGSVDPVPFTVTQENLVQKPVAIAVENLPVCMALLKLDEISKAPLPNVSFKLMDNTGSALKFVRQDDNAYHVDASGTEVFYTGIDGKALLRYVPAGVYTLVEQEYDGYALHEPVNITLTVENKPDNPFQITLENIPLAAEILKVDAYTKAVMKGVSFTLLDKNGKAIPLSLMSNGAYWPRDKAQEYARIQAEKDKNRQDVGTPTNATPTTATPTTIVKDVDVLTTNEKGMARIEYLNLGKYSLEEKAVSGYVTLTGLSFEVTSASSMANPLLYTVYNVPTRLLIEKQNGVTKAPLLGAKFKLAGVDGKAIPLFRQKDGTYRPVLQGETGVEVFGLDDKAQAVILYLPAQEYTVTETEGPVGFGVASPTKIEVGTEKVMHVSLQARKDGDDASAIAETSLAVLDLPMALKISKIHAKTQKPLKGAAFELKAEGALSVPLKFIKIEGAYWHDTQGAITTLEMDEKCEALVYGLPLGKYVLEETVVPRNFFPAAPVNVEITSANTSDAPYEVIVTNTPTVKLGIDSDKFDVIIAIAATVLMLLGLSAAFIIRRKKKI